MIFKAVIFDFGNVIINIEFQRIYEAFGKLSSKPVASVKKSIEESQIFYAYETGQLSDEAFRELICQTLGFVASQHAIDTAWNSLLLDIPSDRINLIHKIREKFPVYLLSNTNPIHIRASNEYLSKAHGIENLDVLFDKLYFSYEMGLWKPNPAIYQEVLSIKKLKPKEVVFFDDNPENIESARAIGMQAILVEPPTSIVTYCKNLF
jgi:putative hydrolase of the HAD superfamily